MMIPPEAIDGKADALKQLASRVTESARRFNLREGLRPEDDRLPSRLVKEAIEKDRQISEDEVTCLVRDYYKLKGWSEQGIPADEAIDDSKE